MKSQENVIEEELPIVPTGIKGLDEIIGGFIKGRTYLVAGETGTGKTIFSLNYLIYGAMINEPGVYILVDEDVNDLMRGAKAFGWDLNHLINSGKLSIMTLLPEFTERFKDRPLDVTVKSIIRDISYEVKRIRAQRLVIDPIAPLITGERDIAWTREYIRSLIISIERNIGTTTVITSEIPTNSNSLSRFGVEEFLATGVIVLGLKRVNKEFKRTLFIRKMRWRPVHPQEFEFEIVPGLGIVVKH
ncbi:MAG: recombinase RecA [Thermoprotei archaeon]|nr:MAG: recombinase RecA [Thermofilum sp. ex4484_79]RLE61306.1 MAG: recombinase RecA [Thermoprotei archaeon]RLE73612.1 MAG: recombinase RecA [Thermoprotei archaeon]